VSGVVLAQAGGVVLELAVAIGDNRAWLSEIDGAIGDGDHGINMNKGFSRAATALGPATEGLAASFTLLGNTLLDGIGGSMGPLYGTFFLDMAATLEGAETLDAAGCSRMLHAGMAGVMELGGAKRGDKTMLDALAPAVEAFDAATQNGEGFAEALDAMGAAAERGRDATRGMVAKLGRAARLGERSRGALDAGAASCCLILQTMAVGLQRRMT
jgi:dihydroxyacetone kinase phosphoprotein-dependent L subunit